MKNSNDNRADNRDDKRADKRGDNRAAAQPLGEVVADWSPPPRPPKQPLDGAHCTIAPLDIARDSADLFAANRHDRAHRNWTYLPYGPFDTLPAYRDWLAAACLGDDPLFFSIIDKRSGRAAGLASYLRIAPQAGSIEVGHIHYSPLMQGATMASEAMFLMMRRVFELGYRRYEWKCNALNQSSRRAAMRLGFSFEGVFRQALVTKGRNRDTAWYSVIDKEWPALQCAFSAWLSPDNFDADGAQLKALSALTARALGGG
ncbi:MAG: GNAT family N-acetyltransferase [Gammaproteobacteria bacterium]